MATGSPRRSKPLPTSEDGWHLPRPLSLQSDSLVQLAKASPPGATENYFLAPSFRSSPMGAISLSRTQGDLRNSIPSGTGCSGGQLIVFTPQREALCTEKPHYHPSPPSVNTVTSQLPSAWSELLGNLILPPPGYMSLCPPGTSGAAEDHRFLLTGSSKALHLTSWLRPAVNSAKHLPLDSIWNDISDLIAEIPILPLASTDLVPIPLGREPSVTYHALRAPLEQLLLADWLSISPPVPSS